MLSSEITLLMMMMIHMLYISMLHALRACEKVASDLELGGGFRQVLRFPPLLTTG